MHLNHTICQLQSRKETKLNSAFAQARLGKFNPRDAFLTTFAKITDKRKKK